MKHSIVRLTVAGVLGLTLITLLRYAPWDGPSYFAWIGILLALLGAACVVRPMGWAGIGTRGRGVGVLAGGALLAAVAIAWPMTVARADPSGGRLDRFLSEYQFREYHEARTRAPLARVEEALRQVSFADMPAAVFLMRARAVAGGALDGNGPSRRPILDMMATPGSGFLPLDVSNPRDLVYGMAGQPWRAAPPPPVRTPEQFFAFSLPGHIRVAFDLRVVEEGDGVVRVSTETRALGNDADARRTFARYWRVIYPGSAIIRRVWLDAIVARAERGT